MESTTPMTRRDALGVGLAAFGSGAFGRVADPVKPRPVAAVATIYTPNSHADVILTKILEGWKHDVGAGPALKLAALYVDQIPEKDMARALCKKHGVPLFDTIEKAVTVGGTTVPVDGVLSIGEHGNYPVNALGQQLYPRKRFFREITAAFEKFGRVVPVFNDKHLSTVWDDAKWVYDRALEMKVPLMSGSSLPVSFRTRPFDVPMGSEIESAVGIGYSGLDVYGFHALECYQAVVERRKNAEKGVKWVRYLEGKAVWQAVDDGWVAADVMDAVYAAVPTAKKKIREDAGAVLFVFEYADGFRGAQFMLRTAQLTGVGVKLKGRPPAATGFEERPEPRYPHFAYLLKAIEAMVHTGKPSYPVERTLLTGGILDRALTSKARAGKKLDTPELAIGYTPADYPHAPEPDLSARPAK
ncbi:MAG TPA: hypothetical protein VMZ71_12710 [Gemmataceae bacterium]|nr:hypothetical protein [Gemmataceae bacterium]